MDPASTPSRCSASIATIPIRFYLCALGYAGNMGVFAGSGSGRLSLAAFHLFPTCCVSDPVSGDERAELFGHARCSDLRGAASGVWMGRVRRKNHGLKARWSKSRRRRFPATDLSPLAGLWLTLDPAGLKAWGCGLEDKGSLRETFAADQFARTAPIANGASSVK